MSSPRILVLQPSQIDPIGPLGDWLAAAGADITVIRPDRAQVPITSAGYHGVICLGGEMGALDDADHPWLASIRALLAAAVTERVPVLGICLGGQLLAAATGGQVRRGADGPEAGPMLVAKRDVATRDPLFAEVPYTPDVLQFHRDVVHGLPPGAELLAAAPKYPNQAFRVGDRAYGLQFHIETTPALVAEWVRDEPELAAAARAGAFDPDRMAELHADLAEAWAPFAARFVALAAQFGGFGFVEPEPGPIRSLPIV